MGASRLRRGGRAREVPRLQVGPAQEPGGLRVVPRRRVGFQVATRVAGPPEPEQGAGQALAHRLRLRVGTPQRRVASECATQGLGRPLGVVECFPGPAEQHLAEHLPARDRGQPSREAGGLVPSILLGVDAIPLLERFEMVRVGPKGQAQVLPGQLSLPLSHQPAREEEEVLGLPGIRPEPEEEPLGGLIAPQAGVGAGHEAQGLAIAPVDFQSLRGQARRPLPFPPFVSGPSPLQRPGERSRPGPPRRRAGQDRGDDDGRGPSAPPGEASHVDSLPGPLRRPDAKAESHLAKRPGPRPRNPIVARRRANAIPPTARAPPCPARDANSFPAMPARIANAPRRAYARREAASSDRTKRCGSGTVRAPRPRRPGRSRRQRFGEGRRDGVDRPTGGRRAVTSRRPDRRRPDLGRRNPGLEGLVGSGERIAGAARGGGIAVQECPAGGELCRRRGVRTVPLGHRASRSGSTRWGDH